MGNDTDVVAPRDHEERGGVCSEAKQAGHQQRGPHGRLRARSHVSLVHLGRISGVHLGAPGQRRMRRYRIVAGRRRPTRRPPSQARRGRCSTGPRSRAAATWGRRDPSAWCVPAAHLGGASRAHLIGWRARTLCLLSSRCVSINLTASKYTEASITSIPTTFRCISAELATVVPTKISITAIAGRRRGMPSPNMAWTILRWIRGPAVGMTPICARDAPRGEQSRRRTW